MSIATGSNENKSGMGTLALMPILFGFFAMGFTDVIGTAMAYVKKDFGLSDTMTSFLPSMIFLWFFVVSIPTGMITTRIGRKNTVLLSLAVTILGTLLPLVSYTKYTIFVAFALLGIGNTIIQAALPALMSNVVSADQLTSRLSLGQFVKALCATVSPFIASLAAQTLGNWKLIFPIYAAITVFVALGLLMTPIKREEVKGSVTTFGGCLALLGNPFILAMFSGIFFVVGVDIGLGCAIPPFLQDVCKVSLDKAAMGPSVYYIAKTVGAFLGAIILAKYSPAKCFPISALMALLAMVVMFFVKDTTLFLSCVVVASLGISNIFGMVFGQAMNRMPEKANEIAGLMVMAIAGGAVIPPVMGFVQGKMGPTGLIAVLIACLVYMLFLGLFVAKQDRK